MRPWRVATLAAIPLAAALVLGAAEQPASRQAIDDALSEGQRHRLRLAQAIAVAERRPEPWSVLLADEFGSSLDRTTAEAMARGVRRWVARSRVCLVAATAHDDLLEPLGPDVLVEVAPGGGCRVYSR